jgi:hypothetical protein
MIGEMGWWGNGKNTDTASGLASKWDLLLAGLIKKKGVEFSGNDCRRDIQYRFDEVGAPGLKRPVLFEILVVRR